MPSNAFNGRDSGQCRAQRFTGAPALLTAASAAVYSVNSGLVCAGSESGLNDAWISCVSRRANITTAVANGGITPLPASLYAVAAAYANDLPADWLGSGSESTDAAKAVAVAWGQRAVASEPTLASLHETAFVYLIPAAQRCHHRCLRRLHTHHGVHMTVFGVMFLLHSLPAVSAKAKQGHPQQGILLHVPRELLVANRSLRALVKQIVAADIDGNGSTIPQLPASALKRVAADADADATGAAVAAADSSTPLLPAV